MTEMLEDEFVVKRASPQDLQSLGEMLDTVFRPQIVPGQGMRKEFPHLICAENAKNLYYLSDGDRPVSMVGVLVQEVAFQGVTMPVASIGSVCTLPGYEKKGLSSKILQQVIQDLTNDHIPLMLVSGTRGLYRRIHCVPVGAMYEVEVAFKQGGANAPHDAERFHLREIPDGQKSEIVTCLAEIYRKEAYRFRRTDQEMNQLLHALGFQRRTYDQRLFTIEQDSDTVAYAVAYHDPDEQGTVQVIEWAGSRTAFLASTDCILEAFQADKLVWHVHADDSEMVARLTTLEATVQRSPLQGTVRALDVEMLFHYLGPLLRERFGAEAEVTAKNHRWTIQLPGVTKALAAVEDLARWLFNREDDGLGIPFVHTDDLNFI